MNGNSPSGRAGKPLSLSLLLRRKNGKIQDLARRSRQLQRVKDLLWPHLPADVRPHCDLANVRDSTLVLVAQSSVWAARLRHTSPQILHAAVNLCKIPVSKVLVRVDPSPFKRQPPRRRRSLSKSVSRHLKEVADALQDEDLKQGLTRIAKRQSDQDD